MFTQGISIVKMSIDVLMDLGKYEAAITQYEFLASYQNRIHDIEGLKETTNSLVALAQKISQPETNAQASLALGELADKSGEPLEAIQHYKDAASYHENALQEEPLETDYKDQTKSSHFHAVRLGITLRAIGTVYSDIKQDKKALEYLLPALDYTEKAGDHPNLGAAHHQLGNCYAGLGETKKAITSYLKALDSFLELNYTDYISNSMGELGNLVSKTNFTSELAAYFTEEKILSGLEDINYSVKILLESKSALPITYIHVLRKLFGVIKLIGFTSDAYLIKYWVITFDKELSEFTSADKSTFAEEKQIFIFYLVLIFKLSKIIGDINDSGEGYTNEVIADLCCKCEDFDEYGQAAFKPYEWIAALLRFHGILPNVEASRLREAIIDAHEKGGHHATFKIN